MCLQRLEKLQAIKGKNFSRSSFEKYFLFLETTQLTKYHFNKIAKSKADLVLESVNVN